MTHAVSVVRTGTANLASVLAGLRRTGANAELTQDPDVIRTASHLVLPGVGAFGAALQELHSAGLIDALRERFQAERPTLAICLGLQMMATTSDESPGVEGLSVLPNSHVVRLPDSVRVPQLGWNRITPEPGCQLLESGYVYFANSFALPQPPQGWSSATFEHGGTFIAAIERGPMLACQFHPELSSAFGRALITRWLNA